MPYSASFGSDTADHHRRFVRSWRIRFGVLLITEDVQMFDSE